MSEPRIIKYNSDKYIEKGDYYRAVWESLKESGVLNTIKGKRIKRINMIFFDIIEVSIACSILAWILLR